MARSLVIVGVLAVVAWKGFSVPPGILFPLVQFAEQVRSSMNLSADPCSDFYQYACGGWINRTTVPKDKRSYARSFSVIDDRNLEILHNILQAADSNGNDRIGTLWQSCMDESSIESAGMDPLRDPIQRIRSVSDVKELPALLGWMERKYKIKKVVYDDVFDGFFLTVGVEVDARNTTRYIIGVSQSGLTMNDPFRYLDVATNRTAQLFQHFKQLQRETGIELHQKDIDLDSAIQNIVELEVQIAQFTKPVEDLRDPLATYNLRSIRNCSGELGLDFLSYLQNMGFTSVNESTPINVYDPGFLLKMGRVLRSTPLPVLKDSILLRTVVSISDLLPRRVRDLNFAFFSSALLGIQEQKPRYKYCIAVVDSLLGDELGQRFLQQVQFSGEQKASITSIVDSVLDEFRATLNSVSWMDSETKQLAITKLQKIKALVGYPNTWTNYQDLCLEKGKFAANVLRSREFLTDYTISFLNQPVDPYRFYMTVPTVNAYYDPTLNSINFPAGILQMPFFMPDPSFPLALNYGGIGTVIGHELVHAFDDQGRQFDGQGLLNPWWPQEVANQFRIRSECLGKQYASFEILDGFHIKPNLTMGENIADNGGVAVAFNAFLKTSGANSTFELVPGINSKKLFFIAFAQDWCKVQAKESLITQLGSDPHSPSMARVNGPLMNSKAFADEFQCPLNSNMNPREKCIIW